MSVLSVGLVERSVDEVLESLTSAISDVEIWLWKAEHLRKNEAKEEE